MTLYIAIFSWARELRFYCSTSAHNRVIHFKTTNNNILNSAYDGKRHYTVNDWKYELVMCIDRKADLYQLIIDCIM